MNQVKLYPSTLSQPKENIKLRCVINMNVPALINVSCDWSHAGADFRSCRSPVGTAAHRIPE